MGLILALMFGFLLLHWDDLTEDCISENGMGKLLAYSHG